MAKICGETVLNILSQKHIVIPHFQRNYDWTRYNVKQLIDDLVEFGQLNEGGNRLYCLGTMSWKEMPDNSSENNSILLIDGQQRLTTILLMLKVISSLITVYDMQKYFFDGYEETIANLRLKRSQNAHVLFKLLNTSENKFEKSEKDTPYFMHYKYIKQCINEEKAKYIFQALKKTIVAWVHYEDNQDPYKTFEVINARGKPLEAKDLIKNYLFSKAYFLSIDEQKHIEDIYDNYIDPIFLDKRFDVNKFYKHVICDVNEAHELPSEKTRIIYDKFKETFPASDLDKYDKLRKAMLDLLHRAKIFLNIFIPPSMDITDIDTAKHHFYKALLQNNTAFIPFYTQLVHFSTNINNTTYELEWDENKLSEDQIYAFIAKYYLFREIDGRVLTRIINDIPKYISGLKKEGMLVTIDSLVDFLEQSKSRNQQLPIADDVIKSLLHLTPSSRLAKFLLLAVELASHEEYNPEPDYYNINDFQIEPIFPKNDNLWKDYFVKENRLHDFFRFQLQKSQIDNLTIISGKLKSTFSNSVFSVKKDKINSICNLNINKILNNFEKYDNSLLVTRLQFIVDNFISFFSIELSDETKQFLSDHYKKLLSSEW